MRKFKAAMSSPFHLMGKVLVVFVALCSALASGPALADHGFTPEVVIEPGITSLGASPSLMDLGCGDLVIKSGGVLNLDSGSMNNVRAVYILAGGTINGGTGTINKSGIMHIEEGGAYNPEQNINYIPECAGKVIPNARFTVRKEFSDTNNITPVTLQISCNDGLPIKEETVVPIAGGYEVVFVVNTFDQNEMDCIVSEKPVPGYSASYESDTNIGTTHYSDSKGCHFEDLVTPGAELLDLEWQNECVITNTPTPVEIEVCKDWVFAGAQSSDVGQEFELRLACDAPVTTTETHGVQDGPNAVIFSGTGNAECGKTGAFTAAVIPDWEGNLDKNGVPQGTECDVTENGTNPAVEPDVSDCTDIYIPLGSEDVSCTVTNTVFYEGIPTLSSYGMAILALLMLGVGLVGFRRLV